MSLIYKQAPKSLLKKVNELTDNSVNVNPTFKHLLKCTSCLWKITFYEPTGKSIHINSKRIRCPICKEKEMNFTKIKIIS
jgi:rubrerythrin